RRHTPDRAGGRTPVTGPRRITPRTTTSAVGVCVGRPHPPPSSNRSRPARPVLRPLRRRQRRRCPRPTHWRGTLPNAGVISTGDLPTTQARLHHARGRWCPPLVRAVAAPT